jgi:hypothetical protein
MLNFSAFALGYYIRLESVLRHDKTFLASHIAYAFAIC